MLDTLLRRPKTAPIDLDSALRLPPIPADLAAARDRHARAHAASTAARNARNAMPPQPDDFDALRAWQTTVTAADRALAEAVDAEQAARAEKDRQTRAFSAECRAALADALDAYEAALADKLAELDELIGEGIALDNSTRAAGVDLQRKAVRGAGHLRGLMKIPTSVVEGWRK